MKANRLLWVVLVALLGNGCNRQSASPGPTNATATATSSPSQPGTFNSVSSPDVATADTIEELRAKAEKGDAQAQYKLGFRYTSGQGVRTNYMAAVKWWRKAAAQDYTEAQCALGLYHLGLPRKNVQRKRVI